MFKFQILFFLMKANLSTSFNFRFENDLDLTILPMAVVSIDTCSARIKF